jgi:FSR family fosmidomycin resistance protein-like MFS transporter
VAAVAVGLGADQRHKGLVLGVFAAGGSIGFMLAPLAVVLILYTLGAQYMPVIILPAIVLAIYFMMDREIVVSESHGLTLKQWFKVLLRGGRQLMIIWLIATCRQIVFILLNSFLPVLTMSRGVSYTKSSFYLAGTFLMGMAAMMVGGHLSDRLGRKRMIAATLFLATPLLYLFLLTSGTLSVVCLLLGSAMLVSATPVNIVLGQEAAPQHMGTASALIIGGAPAIAAMAALPFGILAEQTGIQTAAAIIFILPLLGGLMVFFLKGKS